MDCLVALAALVAPMSAIAAGCSIDGSQVSFGQLDPLGRNEQTAIGTITLRCDGVEGSVVRVGLGSGNSMRFEQREMSDGVHRIRYNLYLDPAHERVFGEDSVGGNALSLAVPRGGVPISIPVYAVIAAGQVLRPGSYSDQITINVDF
jgi:spore coat protein U-like protein